MRPELSFSPFPYHGDRCMEATGCTGAMGYKSSTTRRPIFPSKQTLSASFPCVVHIYLGDVAYEIAQLCITAHFLFKSRILNRPTVRWTKPQLAGLALLVGGIGVTVAQTSTIKPVTDKDGKCSTTRVFFLVTLTAMALVGSIALASLFFILPLWQHNRRARRQQQVELLKRSVVALLLSLVCSIVLFILYATNVFSAYSPTLFYVELAWKLYISLIPLELRASSESRSQEASWTLNNQQKEHMQSPDLPQPSSNADLESNIINSAMYRPPPFTILVNHDQLLSGEDWIAPIIDVAKSNPFIIPKTVLKF